MCIYCKKMVRTAKDFLQAEDRVSRDGRRNPVLIDEKEKALDALAEALLAAEGWPPPMRTPYSRCKEV